MSSGVAAVLRHAGFRVRVEFTRGSLVICGSDRGLPSARRIDLGAVWVLVVRAWRPGPVVAMVTWLPADDPDALVSVATHDLCPAQLLRLVADVREQRRRHESGEVFALPPAAGLWLATGGGVR